MNKFLTSALASLSLLAPNHALAQNTFDDHLELFETLKSVGVVVNINHKLYCVDTSIDGFYHKEVPLLVICQDNAQAGGPQVDWTPNDLDTLRHEAHHVVQDCASGIMGDGKFDLLFSEEDDFVEFVAKSSFTLEQLKALVGNLAADGLTGKDILIEVEAYIVAEDIHASVISDKVKDFCN